AIAGDTGVGDPTAGETGPAAYPAGFTPPANRSTRLPTRDALAASHARTAATACRTVSATTAGIGRLADHRGDSSVATRRAAMALAAVAESMSPVAAGSAASASSRSRADVRGVSRPGPGGRP